MATNPALTLIQLADRRAANLDIKSLLQTGALPAAEATFLDYAAGLLDRIEANAEVSAALASVGVNAARAEGACQRR
jgi:hypothetical protein